MQCRILFPRKSKNKNIISLSSAEFAHRVVMINKLLFNYNLTENS